MATGEELQRQYGQVIAKAWADERFKERLLEDPEGTLRDEGVEVPQGVALRAYENTSNVIHFVLPPKPKDMELSEEDLQQVVGGKFQYGCCMSATGCLGCDMGDIGCYGA